MSDFFFTSATTRAVVLCFAVIAAVLQATLIVLTVIGRKRFRLLDMSVLLLACLAAYMLAAVDESATSLLYSFYGYGALRYAAFALVAGFGAAQLISGRAALMPVTAALLLIPPAESALKGAYVYAYIAAVALICAYSATGIMRETRRINTEISALSVKESLDIMKDGLLFSEENGAVLLVNRCMYEMMDELFNKQLTSSRLLIDRLEKGDMRGGRRVEAGGELVIASDGGAVRHIIVSRFPVGKRERVQVLAADITEQWNLTLALTQKEALLKKQKDDILMMIDGLEQTVYREELLNKKARVHDVIGQRIAMVQKALRDGAPSRPDKLADDILTIMKDIDRGEEDSPKDMLMRTMDAFSMIGVDINVAGSLPQDGGAAFAAAGMIRECATNAVRHGHASSIDVSISETGGGWLVIVKNDGSLPGSIEKGGGFAAMERYAAECGGSLTIKTDGVFTVELFLRGEGK